MVGIVLKKNALVINIISLFTIVLLLVFNETVFLNCKNAIFLYLNNVLPSLLPFVLLTSYLIQTNSIYMITFGMKSLFAKLFNIPYISTPAIVLGLFFGYPNSARFLSKQYLNKEISTNEYIKLVCLTSLSNPIYVFTYIGNSLLNNFNQALILYISHVLSAIICYIIFFKRSIISKHIILQKYSFANSNNTFIFESMKILSLMLVFMCIFSVVPALIIQALKSVGIFLPTTLQALLFSLFEISTGIEKIAHLTLSPRLLLSLISFALSFASIMIHIQILNVCASRKNIAPIFIKYKLLQGIFSFIITYCISIGITK